MQVSRGTWLLLAGYLLTLAVVGGLLLWARRAVTAELSSSAATANWEAWRGEVARAQDAVVQRRVPKSPEPPLLVVFRDSFGPLVAAAWAAASVLYGFAALVAHHACRRPPNAEPPR